MTMNKVIIYIASGLVARIAATDAQNTEVTIIDTDVSDTNAANLKEVKSELGIVDTFKPEKADIEDFAWLEAPYLEDEYYEDDDTEPKTQKLGYD